MRAVLYKIGFGVLGILIVAGISVYLALSDRGAIDVNQAIISTNQEGFAQQVLPNTQAQRPNGGLSPVGGQETPQPPPPPAPEPQATSTDAASTTEATGDIPEDAAAPRGSDTGVQEGGE